jgi:hypothetical protein
MVKGSGRLPDMRRKLKTGGSFVLGGVACLAAVWFTGGFGSSGPTSRGLLGVGLVFFVVGSLAVIAGLGSIFIEWVWARRN